MARLNREDIERLKLAGQAKHLERARKREKREKLKPYTTEQFEQRLDDAVTACERWYPEAFSEEFLKEIKQLLLPCESPDVKAFAYTQHLENYDNLIFYAWAASEELCDVAYHFWNEVLNFENTVVTGNSIVKILSLKPNEKLYDILKDHRDKFFAEECFKNFLKMMVERHLKRGRANCFPDCVFTQEDIILWKRILALF